MMSKERLLFYRGACILALALLLGPVTGCGIPTDWATATPTVSHSTPQAPVEYRCPVTAEILQVGQPGVVAYIFEGKTYLFASEESLLAFKAAPGRYLPTPGDRRRH